MGRRERIRAMVVNELMKRYNSGDKSGLTIKDVIAITRLSYDEARRIMIEIAAMNPSIEYERGRLYIVEAE